jgi:class 3 adenylate cyclase
VLEPVLTPVAMPLPIVVLFFVLNIGGVSVVIFSLLRYFMVRLVAERAKSELLLLNVLPQPIASRLKAGERPIADHIDEAAVLFADLVGFTPLTEEMSPADLIDLLDHLFSEFDGLAAARGLEKIKTVGDAYMVVGGVPAPREDAAEDIAAMALDMLKVAGAHQRSDGEHLQLRIGIDVGPVVAGVIGHQKFTYDLWGDTVNTASRMESHGIPGYIQVTPRAYERLRGRFSFEQREPVEIKGKGLMSPLLLTEHRALDSIQE